MQTGFAPVVFFLPRRTYLGATNFTTALCEVESLCVGRNSTIYIYSSPFSREQHVQL